MRRTQIIFLKLNAYVDSQLGVNNFFFAHFIHVTFIMCVIVYWSMCVYLCVFIWCITSHTCITSMNVYASIKRKETWTRNESNDDDNERIRHRKPWRWTNNMKRSTEREKERQGTDHINNQRKTYFYGGIHDE